MSYPARATALIALVCSLSACNLKLDPALTSLVKAAAAARPSAKPAASPSAAAKTVSSPGNAPATLANGNALISAGGGNVVAAGGGSVIANNAGNVIAGGGGNVISNDGGNAALPPSNSLAERSPAPCVLCDLLAPPGGAQPSPSPTPAGR